MGYYMYTRESSVRIDAGNKAKALKALLEFDAARPEFGRLFGRKQTPLTLEDALFDLGWDTETDAKGNITDMRAGDGAKLCDEDLAAIAPCVRPGSYIVMTGEDDRIWRWYFDGKTCLTQESVISFPEASGDGVIHTLDWAAALTDALEDILEAHGAKVPSPDDGDKSPDNCAVLYGGVYSEFVDAVEDSMKRLLDAAGCRLPVVCGMYSGNV